MHTKRMPETVVITGASAGVGRATAREFARHGACVALLARGQDGLLGAARDVERAGGKALALPTDVADAKQVRDAAAAVEETFGPIDVWVNNAMVSVFSPVREMNADEFRRVTEVTYLGVVHGTLAALEFMLPRDHGMIVQVGSALAYRGIPLQSAYSAAKHAVHGFTESLRAELLHDHSNVQVTTVNLPAMNTPHFALAKSHMPHKAQPAGPVYQPEVAASAIYWAAHHARRELMVGLPTVAAVYGSMLAPGYTDHWLAEHGFDDQQTSQPEDPNRPDNLFEPVPGDHGAHGDFDERAHSFSPQLWANTHRALLAAGLCGLGVAAALALARAARNRAHREMHFGGERFHESEEMAEAREYVESQCETS